MAHFDLGEVRVPHGGEVVILGWIHDDNGRVSKMTLVEEGSHFLIDSPFESLIFPTDKNGRPVDEKVVAEMRTRAWHSIERSFQWQEERKATV
ncbi:MAG: hypothetical protein AAB584_01850 [Patescibacteria group bacterium]